MFEIKKSFHFEAGHELKYHDGVCRRPHGHSYQMEIGLRAEELETSGPKTNMVVDFGDIQAATKPIIDEYLDHHWLNETLRTESPTAEFIARWVYLKLKPKLPHLWSVTIAETGSSTATYWTSPK